MSSKYLILPFTDREKVVVPKSEGRVWRGHLTQAREENTAKLTPLH